MLEERYSWVRLSFWIALFVGCSVWGLEGKTGVLVGVWIVAGFAQAYMAVEVVSSWRGGNPFGLKHWLCLLGLLFMAVILPFTPWWKLYLATLILPISMVLIYLIAPTLVRR